MTGERDTREEAAGKPISGGNYDTNSTGHYAPVGYPTPQYPPPPPGYPTHPYPSQGTAYYGSAQYPGMQPEPIKVNAFARAALILLILFMFGSVALGVVTWLIFGDTDPVFKVAAFSMPNFVVTNNHTKMEANWVANIIAQNPSHKLEIFLAGVEGGLVYRGVPLGLTMMEPFHLAIESQGKMNANFSVPGPGDKDGTGGPVEAVVRQMEDDRKGGSVDFDLRMAMEATFSSNKTEWTKRIIIRVICGDIRVNFPSPTGGGTWDGASGDCLAFDD